VKSRSRRFEKPCGKKNRGGYRKKKPRGRRERKEGLEKTRTKINESRNPTRKTSFKKSIYKRGKKRHNGWEIEGKRLKTEENLRREKPQQGGTAPKIICGKNNCGYR